MCAASPGPDAPSEVSAWLLSGTQATGSSGQIPHLIDSRKSAANLFSEKTNVLQEIRRQVEELRGNVEGPFLGSL